MAKTKASTKTKIAVRPTGKSASRKPKGSTTKSASHKGQSAGTGEVTIDRRRGARRDGEQAETPLKAIVPPVTLERRQKVNRRRQIDPTTCERDYTDDEVEFMNALDEYKRKNGRMFPTCSEVLEVVRSLGYVRLSPNELAAHTTTAAQEKLAVAVVAKNDDEDSAEDWR